MYRILALSFCLFAVAARADFVVSHTFSEQDLDVPSNVSYEVQLLILALDATVDDFGDYDLQPVDRSMSQPRAIEMMETNRYPNYVRTLGYNQTLSEKHELAFVRFPAYLGVLGYRTCFISELIKDKFSSSITKEELLQYSHAIGLGWADKEILRDNGFEVFEISDWNSMYLMTAKNRVDLFCRGAGEVLNDYRENIGMKGLAYDRDIAIYYPLPHFFYTNKNNKKLISRLTIGLERIYKNGKLEDLWLSEFQESLRFARLENRKLFKFSSPLVHSIDFDYEKYVYQP